MENVTGDEENQDGIAVRLERLEPAIVRAGQDVTLEVTLSNNTREAADKLEVSVTLQRNVPISRTALLKWTQPSFPERAAGSLTETLRLSLPAGDSATRTITIPASALPTVDAATWGPRGLLVSARDRGGEASGSLRTWLVFAAPHETTTLPFASVVSLTPSIKELTAALAEDDATRALREEAGGRVGSLAQALGGPATTFLVDPLLLSPRGEAEDQGGGDPQSGDLNRALSSAAHPPILLPAGNADLAALAHADKPDLLERAVQDGRDLAEAAGVSGRSDVLVTRGRLDAVTVRAAHDAGLTSLLGWSSLTPILNAPAWTPSARVDVPLPPRTEILDGGGSDETDRVSLPAVLTDADLSTVLTGALPTIGPAEVTDDRLAPLQARQLSLAMTAVIQRERPNEPRALAVHLDTASLEEPEAAETASTCLDALAHAPWVEATALVDMLDDSKEMKVHQGAALPESRVDNAELRASTINGLTDLLAGVDMLSEATSDPDAVTTPPMRRTQMLLALPWRDAAKARADQALSVRSSLAAMPQRVRIAPSSTINMLSTSADLPVRVINGLPVAIRTHVTLIPPDARLSPKKTVELTVPAHGEATALIPVEARGSGNFQLHAIINTPQGVPLGEPGLIDVRLRAEWEGRGAVVGGVVLAAVVLIGIVRTARRSRRAAAEATPTASDAVRGERG